MVTIGVNMDDSQWLPLINLNQCVGCGACISNCPTNALSKRGGKAALVRPDLCIYCANCESLCPHNAIELPYLICIDPHAQGKVNS
ncbi:MAG: 4Fe-4S dicluster domain-containing protein [Anaerolineaceae bacterium]|nr:4Fe-4S dicluster domain-containing protein [Anaerolineaceae bacterium]